MFIYNDKTKYRTSQSCRTVVEVQKLQRAKDKSLRHAEKHMTDIVTCPKDGYFSNIASHKHNMHKLLNSILFKLHAN